MTMTFIRDIATRLTTLFAISLLLSACGGGGGGAIVPVTVSIGDVQALEGNAGSTMLVFPITLSAAAGGDIVLNFATSDVSASGKALCSDAGADYLTTVNSISIPAGAISATISIPVCGDGAFEPNEKLRVTLTSVGAYGVLGTITATGLLVNDDAGGLNDTGAALCSDGATTDACPTANYPGQDAQSGRDSNSLTNGDADGRAGFSYTKLDNAGNPLAINAVSWACVRDNVTGLMWEAKTNDGVQGKDIAYTYANAEAYVATVNALPTPPCGYTDWRLPTPQELASQVDSSLSAGTVAVVTAFPEQKAAAYWSSLANKGDATRAWFVEFSVGLFGHQPKDGSDGTGHVRLVRSTVAPPATRYTANGDGTLIDHQTGLMWRECSDGLTGDKCASGAAQSHTWQDALQRVAAVNANPAGLGLGYGDWRLPNRNELGSIIDYSRRDPAIDTAKFVGVRAVGYWTSTPDASNPGRAWFVDMKDGGTAFASQDDVQGKPILLVRDL